MLHIYNDGVASDSFIILKDITPQLFARLSSHPEHVVRKQLEGMLVMLAKLSPWSVVYPSLVDVNSYEEEPSEELQHVLACLVRVSLILWNSCVVGRCDNMLINCH